LGISGANPTAIEVMSSTLTQALFCQALGYEELKPLAACPYLIPIELSAAADDAAQAGAAEELLERAAETAVAVDAALAQNENAARPLLARAAKTGRPDRETSRRPSVRDLGTPLPRRDLR
jgi:hypothetical protein